MCVVIDVRPCEYTRNPRRGSTHNRRPSLRVAPPPGYMTGFVRKRDQQTDALASRRIAMIILQVGFTDGAYVRVSRSPR